MTGKSRASTRLMSAWDKKDPPAEDCRPLTGGLEDRLGGDGLAAAQPGTYLLSSFTGSTIRPKVEFVTAANDAYHAAIAVAMPMYPPACTMLLSASALPTPRTMNVAASRKNTTATATLTRSDAMNM